MILKTRIKIKYLSFLKVILLVVVLVACKKDKKVETFFNNNKLKSIEYLNNNNRVGEYREFFNSGNLKELSYYENGLMIDSSITYNENGSIENIRFFNDSTKTYFKFYKDNEIGAEGYLLNNGKKSGIWKYFEKNKLLVKEQFIKTKENPQKINQRIFYDKEKINKERSTYFKVFVPDTVQVKTNVIGKIEYNFSNDEKEILNNIDNYIFFYYSDKLKKDFSNYSNVKLDASLPINNSIPFKMNFNKLGENYLRGVIEKTTLLEKKDSTHIKISKMYINCSIYVRE